MITHYDKTYQIWSEQFLLSLMMSCAISTMRSVKSWVIMSRVCIEAHVHIITVAVILGISVKPQCNTCWMSLLDVPDNYSIKFAENMHNIYFTPNELCTCSWAIHVCDIYGVKQLHNSIHGFIDSWLCK